MTKKKDPKDLLKVGRRSDYRPELCDLLIGHMKTGSSFESFASVAKCSIQTLYSWSDANPEFLEAKKVGRGLSLQWWESVIKMQAMGQLKRVKTEEPKVDSQGNLIYDKKGNVMMKRTYESAAGSPAALIFALKNMHGWRDKKDINIGGQEEAPPVRMQLTSGLSKEELKKSYEELKAKAKK